MIPCVNWASDESPSFKDSEIVMSVGRVHIL